MLWLLCNTLAFACHQCHKQASIIQHTSSIQQKGKFLQPNWGQHCGCSPEAPGFIVCDHAKFRHLRLLHDLIQEHSMYLQR